MMSCGSAGITISLTELNPHFVCVLCFGYFVDATTVTECMHTFCKSCIVTFLSTNHHCPHCDTLLSRTRPLSSLRLDRVMQAMVYKTVPGLFQTEMRRRINFYNNKPDARHILSDSKNEDEDLQNYVFSSDDSISLVIQYANKCANEEKLNNSKKSNHSDERTSNYQRYFKCPATLPIYVLKLLIKVKHNIPDSLRVELLYGEERLLDSWTLMEVAYIFRWPRETPMEILFQLFATRKVKRKKLVFKKRLVVKSNSISEPKKRAQHERENCNILSEKDEPIKKMPKLVVTHTLPSPEEPHPRPPTPPETPEQMTHDDNTYSTQQLEKVKNTFLHENDKSNREMEKGNKEKESTINTDDISKSSTTTSESLKVEQYSTENDHGDDEDSEASLEVDFSQVEINEENNSDIPDEHVHPEKIMTESASQRKYPLLTESLQYSSNNHSRIKKDKQKKISGKEDACISNFNENTKLKNGDQINVKNPADINDIGVLDLSYHARTVRAKKCDDISTPSHSPSPHVSEKVSDHSVKVDTLSAASGNGFDIKNSSILQKMSAPITTSNNKMPLNWRTPPMLSNPAVGPHTTAFRDLVTLSHAAVQLQIAMAHAQAQAQVHVHAQKLQENVLHKLKASESLSFINGSGDTLTISPISGNQANGRIKAGIKKYGKKGAKLTPKNKAPDTIKCHSKFQTQLKKRNEMNGTNVGPVLQKPAGLTNKPSAISAILKNGGIQSNKLPAKVISALKSSALTCESSKLSHLSKNVASIDSFKKTSSNKVMIPKSALSSLKIPLVNISQPTNNAPVITEKDKQIDSTRTGDEVFKITNKKLIECLRQQHHNFKPKNNCSPKLNSNEGDLPDNSSIPEEKIPSVLSNLDSVEHKPVDEVTPVDKNICKDSPTMPVAPVHSQSVKTCIPTTNNQNNVVTSLALPGLKVSSTSFLAQTGISNAVRTTNTSIRQIPNPSRLHHQSVSRLSVGSNRPLINGKRQYNISTGDRLESLTRTLHEKVAASAAGMVSSLAR